MQTENTRNRTLSNFVWRFAERCGGQGVSFIVSIVLARLLAPEVYGTIALVTVFTGILNVFISSGMGTALVQKKNADDLDFSSLFFFNIFMCIMLYTLLFLGAPLIANFYQNPELIPVIRVLGLTLVISGVKNVQMSYVSKNLIFKKFFFATLGGTIGAAAVGIAMAYMGFGVWALVAQQLIKNIVDTMILWITVPWRPKKMFSLQRLKGLFSYGWKMLISSLLDRIYNDLRQMIIGKMYSSEDLAFYNRGKTFPDMIVTNINSSIDSVLLPTMAKEQDDCKRVKSMTRRAIRTSTYIMAPLMIGLAVCAEPVVRLLLTDAWIDCVPFLRIFCITYMLYPMHTANLNAIKAMGRSDWFLKLEIAKKIVGLSIVVSTMWFGVMAMAYSLLLSTLLSTMINAYPNKKLLNYSWFEQMKDILPHIGLALCMGILILFLQYLPLPTIAVLLLQILAGGAIYIGLSVVLKVEMFDYMLNTVKGFMRKKVK